MSGTTRIQNLNILERLGAMRSSHVDDLRWTFETFITRVWAKRGQESKMRTTPRAVPFFDS